MRYVKAITAAVASFAATIAALAADEQIDFDEVNIAWAAGVALVTAVATALSPKNSEPVA